MMTLHKHGNKAIVEQWAETTKLAYLSSGFEEMSNEITVIGGQFDIDELNHLIGTSGYMEKFLEFHAIELDLRP